MTILNHNAAPVQSTPCPDCQENGWPCRQCEDESFAAYQIERRAEAVAGHPGVSQAAGTDTHTITPSPCTCSVDGEPCPACWQDFGAWTPAVTLYPTPDVYSDECPEYPFDDEPAFEHVPYRPSDDDARWWASKNADRPGGVGVGEASPFDLEVCTVGYLEWASVNLDPEQAAGEWEAAGRHEAGLLF